MADTAYDTIHRDADRPAPLPLEERLGRALFRLERAIQRKPGFGRSTSVSRTTLVDGLRCESTEGDHVVGTDLGPALGGHDTGPNPSALLRAALGSCLTMGYRLRAARHGVPINGIRVEVETDSELDGMLDPDSPSPPGFIDIRYRVVIDSPAPADVVDRLMDEADRLSPLLDAVTRANRVTRVPSGPAAGEGDR